MAQGQAIEEPQGRSGDRPRSYLEGTYGALLVERASHRPELWGFVFMAVLGGIVFLATADPKPQALSHAPPAAGTPAPRSPGPPPAGR